MLAAAIIVGGMPATTDNLLSGKAGMTANAQSAVGNPLGFWETTDFYSSETIFSDIDIVDNAEVNIGKSAKCCITVKGNLSVGAAKLIIHDGSYLIVTGSLTLGKNSQLVCEGNAKVILNGEEIYVSPSASYSEDDWVGTSLTDLEYIPDLVPGKDYFRSNGVYYSFDGSMFSKITENSKTKRLKQLCTDSYEGYSAKISPAAKEILSTCRTNYTVPQSLIGYCIDGETCDEMVLASRPYNSSFGATAKLKSDLNAFKRCGAFYIVTEEEAKTVVAAPVFKSASVNVGNDLKLYFAFSDVTAETVGNFKVVLTGECEENGIAQTITADKDFGYVVTATITPNNMNEVITGKIYYNDIDVGIDFSYSVAQYLTALYNKSTALSPIVETIQFYGKTSANYFDGKNNNISSDVEKYMSEYKLTPDKAAATLADYAPNYTTDEAKLSLVLNSTVAMRFYLAGLPDGYEVKNSQGEVVYTAKKGKNGVFIEIPGCTPLGMHNTISLGKYKMSCMTWVYRVLTDPTLYSNQKTRDLAVSLYAYQQSVYDYVHKNN